jgi:hypothetical protein
MVCYIYIVDVTLGRKTYTSVSSLGEEGDLRRRTRFPGLESWLHLDFKRIRLYDVDSQYKKAISPTIKDLVHCHRNRCGVCVPLSDENRESTVFALM